MNRLLLLACIASSMAHAAKVGDTYEVIVAEEGVPKSKMGAGSNQILNYPDSSIQFRDGKVVAIKPVDPAASTPAAGAPQAIPGKSPVEIVKAEQQKAIARVKLIVNQPLEGVPRTGSLRAGRYPYWFHEGAETPDFNRDDIRLTQNVKEYEKWPYVYSDLDPRTAYRGSQVEFNAKTKYFYVDRSLPKKRLTEQEMIEINRLYRTIGRCETQLRTLAGK